MKQLLWLCNFMAGFDAFTTNPCRRQHVNLQSGKEESTQGAITSLQQDEAELAEAFNVYSVHSVPPVSTCNFILEAKSDFWQVIRTCFTWNNYWLQTVKWLAHTHWVWIPHGLLIVSYFKQLQLYQGKIVKQNTKRTNTKAKWTSPPKE